MNKIASILALLIFISGCNQTKEVEGTLRLGHEVRSFTDTSDNKEYWLIDKSGKLRDEYQKVIGQEIINSQPIHARLEVKDIGKPEDGFGAEYDGGYELQKIIQLSLPQRNK